MLIMAPDTMVYICLPVFVNLASLQSKIIEEGTFLTHCGNLPSRTVLGEYLFLKKYVLIDE
jgi:hypothetical protein